MGEQQVLDLIRGRVIVPLYPGLITTRYVSSTRFGVSRTKLFGMMEGLHCKGAFADAEIVEGGSNHEVS